MGADVRVQQIAISWPTIGDICLKNNLFIGTTDESLGGIVGHFDKSGTAD